MATAPPTPSVVDVGRRNRHTRAMSVDPGPFDDHVPPELVRRYLLAATVEGLSPELIAQRNGTTADSVRRILAVGEARHLSADRQREETLRRLCLLAFVSGERAQAGDSKAGADFLAFERRLSERLGFERPVSSLGDSVVRLIHSNEPPDAADG